MECTFFFKIRKFEQIFVKFIQIKIRYNFSIIIYYDKTKLQKVYYCVTRDQEANRNGIRCAHVDYRSAIMTFNQLIGYNRFIDNEFCITDKNQILPLYGITFRRIKYLVIWRD